jgi:SAM-dependent methyltransferase
MSTNNGSHTGGDKNFWRNKRVDNYDAIQTILSEKKAVEQENIARIINYFCDLYQIDNPSILDIGCGPGTPITLTRYILEKVPECSLVGADGSEEMIAKFNDTLSSAYGGRFSGLTQTDSGNMKSTGSSTLLSHPVLCTICRTSGENHSSAKYMNTCLIGEYLLPVLDYGLTTILSKKWNRHSVLNLRLTK